MSTPSEFAALLRADPESGFSPPAKQSKKTYNKPPQAPVPILKHEQTPLLPPPVSPGRNEFTDTLRPLPPPSASRRHTRASSDFAWAASAPTATADPSHPLTKNPAGLPPRRGGHSNKPPLRAITTTAATAGILGIPPPPPRSAAGGKRMHRRIKSDLPRVQFSGVITKSDLLKNFPDPRWSGKKNLHSPNRSGSGSELLQHVRTGSSGGFNSYGSLGLSIPESKGMHVRTKSDLSMSSAVTDMTKSALIKEVTKEGRIRFQLPKDNFRILMDCSLEAGNVYKRKLLEDEDALFVGFHTEDPTPDPTCPCACTCDKCNRCYSKQKALPPDLYVMAVDSTLYRRMMDEVVGSETMPCGLFFCGHHEDVRYPDIKIAVAIVGMTFVFLLVATEAFGGD